eukprot:6227033-Amphidinium_carterae.1
MASTGVKRRFNMLPLPDCKRAKQRTLHSSESSLVAETSPCVRARIVFSNMEHTSKDESAKVVRLTALGARHIVAVKELAFGAMVEIESVDCTDFKGNLSLFANSRTSLTIRVVEDDGSVPDFVPDITPFGEVESRKKITVV